MDYRGVVLAHNDHFTMAEQRCAQSTMTTGEAPGGGAACDRKKKAADGLYMTANVPTLGVTTLYATVVGDALPQACLALLVYLVGAAGVVSNSGNTVLTVVDLSLLAC